MPVRQAQNSATAGTTDTVGVAVTSFAVGETALALICWWGTQTITSVTLTGESNMTVLGAPQTSTMFQDGRCQWAVIDSVTASGNKTATVTLSGTANAVKIDLWRISGAGAHGTPVGASGNSGTLSVNVTTTVANAAIFAGGIADGGTWTAGTGYTKETVGADSYNNDGSEYDIDVGTVGTKTVDATATSGQWVWNAVEIYSSAASEQEGFRFGVDDASESTHTWEAAQDTNITAPSGQTRVLNIIVNATSALGTKTFKLQYRKVGTSDWYDMPVQ